MKRAETIKVSGGAEYAKVAERTKLFWEENPHGSILSSHQLTENGSVIFETTIIRDSTNPEGGKSNGHAMGKVEKDKDFEKYETISLGRALAKAGYLASGEIASLEEMEDFMKDQETKRQLYIEEQIEAFEKAKTLDELKQLWLSTNKTEKEIIEAKDKRKAELEAKDEN